MKSKLLEGKPSRRCLEPKDKKLISDFLLRFLGFHNSREIITHYEELMWSYDKYHTRIYTEKSLKTLYSYALRYAAGLNVEPIPFLKSNKQGYPKKLNFVKKYLDSNDVDSKRAVLTILQLYKLWESKGSFSIRSITEPYKGNLEPEWLSAFDKVLKAEFPPEKVEDRIFRLTEEFHMSTKMGPNGPAIISIPIDREAIRGTKIESAILQLLELYKGSILTEMFQVSDTPPATKPRSRTKRLSHSRLRIKHEPGGKSRVFAIVDWFTQSALLPIHKYLMNWLGSQYQDGTSSHSNAAKAVSEWSDGRFGTNLWSFDLTTATDRYPRFLEKRVMSAVFGPKIADLWETIISKRNFDHPTNRTYVNFATGQPLGALSSWASFAVTHHMHVRTAGEICGIKHKDLYYRVIGDDICIARDSAVAQQYISMMEDLKVPFSRDKSILPPQMKSDPVCELAKRIFVKGVELSPLPPDAILELSPFKRQLLENAWDRGYTRVDRIYSVQSYLTSLSDYISLTFPVGTGLPLPNYTEALTVVRSCWKDRHQNPPAGINRGWFIWDEVPHELINEVTKQYVVKLLRDTVLKMKRDFQEIVHLERSSNSKSQYQGGDWKPEPWVINSSLLYLVTNQVTNELNCWGNSVDLVFPLEDLYRSLASLHDYIGPKQFWFNTDWRNEKKRTRVLFSRLHKYVYRNIRTMNPELLCPETEV